MKTYNKRVWLNRPESYSSSNVFSFDGDVNWNGKMARSTFIQISNCDHTIKFYKTDNDTMDDFIKKIEKLESVISEFKDHLKFNH